MQHEQFLGEDLDCEVGVWECGQLLQGEEVDVVCGVYCLGCAEDGVGDRVAAAEEGGIFDVVDAVFAISLALENGVGSEERGVNEQ
jgi:hypothetical protein